MLLRIVVEAEAKDPQAAKEDLAMAMERYAPARVVEVAPVYRQMGFAEGRGNSEKGRSVVSPAATDLKRGPFARADAAMRAARAPPAGGGTGKAGG